ncbi:MAG: hypothetical protein J4428_03840 [Candidatus Aenigmarchaeota archaeon]|nr:hypothetical protein [Candidatus Aenigmarchaeota archaeon]
MLQVIKHIDIKGKQKGIVSIAISNVIREFEERAHVKSLKKLDVYVTTNPIAVCKIILNSGKRLKVKRHGEMREWVCGNKPNFSYWEKGKSPIIMLNANEEIFRTNNIQAISGLFAHELMHLLNKQDGIEDILNEEMENAADRIFYLLDRHKPKKPFTIERLLVSFTRVGSTMTLLIKDILANSRVMAFGFDNQLYENYKVVLENANKIFYTENGILNDLKKDKKHVLDDAFLAYIGLNMTWVTFKMFQNKRYLELKNMVNMKIPDVIRKNGKPVIEDMMNLRSGKDRKTIRKLLILAINNYYKTVEYFCKKL